MEDHTSIIDIWHSNNEIDWKNALERYWTYVRKDNYKLEKKLNNISITSANDIEDWYLFLLNEYFRWKYTAPNRYASTTINFKKAYKDNNKPLDKIIERIFSFDKNNIHEGLKIASSIHGLGTAGASGLLAIIFPSHFATVDQFAVRALRQIKGLPEIDKLKNIAPENLRIKNGVILIEIMREKAKQLNVKFKSNLWNPRKVDMVLWGSRDD